jgi:serine/threonine protein kinase
MKMYDILKGSEGIIKPIDFINNSIILPYYSYTLYDIIYNIGSNIKFKNMRDYNKMIQTIIKKIAVALYSCKKNSVIHRDVKPLNIVVNLETIKEDIDQNVIDQHMIDQDIIDLVLIDFGISTVENSTVVINGDSTTKFKEHYVVSRWYRAPELITKNSYSYGVDIFALGVIILQLLLGDYPFTGNDELHQLELYNIFHSEVINIETCIEYIKKNTKLNMEFEYDPLIIEIVLACLIMNPSDRITVETIIQLTTF